MPLTFSRRRWLAAAALAPAWPRVTAAETGLPVLHDDGATLSVLDPIDLRVLARQPLPQPMTAWLAPGLLAGDDGTLLAVDGPDARVHARRRIGSGRPRAARSRDGRWLLVLPAAGTELQLLDAALQPRKSWPLPGPVAWLTDAPHRRAFVLALAAPAQLWVISYDERAEDFYEGLVHDFRMGEGVPQRAFHNPRRIALPAPLLEASADAEDTEFAGRAMVVNLDVRKVVARPPQLQPVAAGAAARFRHQGVPALAVPLRADAGLACFRCGDWSHLATVPLPAAAAKAFAWPRARQVVALPAAASAALPRLDAETLRALPPLPLPAPALDLRVGADGADLFVALQGRAGGVQAWRAGESGARARAALDGVLGLGVMLPPA